MFSEYERLIHWIDRFLARIQKPRCPSGCAVCCRPDLALFPVEAFRLRKAFLDLPAEARRSVRSERGSGGPACSLLVGGGCLLYPERPVLCRTHGVPFFTKTEEEAEAWEVHGGCEVLEGPDVLLANHPAGISLLDLDRVNEALAAVNLNFLRNLPLSGTGLPDRIPIERIVQPCGWEQIDAYL